jgi:adenylate cyclase
MCSPSHLPRRRRALTDIFAVQDEVTLQIVSALRITLSPPEKARLSEAGTNDVAAHDAFPSAPRPR